MALENLWELGLENLRNRDSHHLKLSWIIDSCRGNSKDPFSSSLDISCSWFHLVSAHHCRLSLSSVLWPYKAAAMVMESDKNNNTYSFLKDSVYKNSLLAPKLSQLSYVFKFAVLELSESAYCLFSLSLRKIYNCYLHSYNWHFK